MSESVQPPPDADGVSFAEHESVERNLTVCQRAALVGSLLGAASDLATGNLASAVILAVGSVAVVLSMLLLRAGRLNLAAAVFQILFVAVIHASCAIGEGIHDTAAVLYPVAILTAALALDRRLLVAVTVASMASVALLVYQQQPADPDWPSVFDISLILVVTAVAVDLLLLGVLRGAVEARGKERRLTEAYAELEARNAELERFTYVVSHDLKSPLVTIRGFLDYVEQDARAGDLERLMQDNERIRTAADRMGHLLDDLLELSRTGRIARPHEDVSFGEVVREAQAVVGGRIGSSGLRVEMDESAASRTVHGDRARLVELVQNLLDNAAKYTGAQSEPRVVVAVREPADDSDPVFTLTDNGLGIDPVHHDRVFELFHKLDPEAEGTGLGLALVRRIVETHGGRIWVESEGRGRGSTFCFTLQRESSRP